jgi:hypothetical protein
MTKQERDKTLAWIRRWQKVGPILEDLRLRSLHSVDTAASIEAFETAFKSAQLLAPVRKSSGLIEQQRWFRRGHR